MPAYLIGSREHRVDQAQALSGRAHAVIEKTRQLVALEVENILKSLNLLRRGSGKGRTWLDSKWLISLACVLQFEFAP
jgi:hypothetical protein